VHSPQSNSGVPDVYSKVSNNHTGTIINFTVKFAMYDAYSILYDYINFVKLKILKHMYKLFNLNK
jgi:hypothetical protein